jgi:hypothetical protein
MRFNPTSSNPEPEDKKRVPVDWQDEGTIPKDKEPDNSTPGG